MTLLTFFRGFLSLFTILYIFVLMNRNSVRFMSQEEQKKVLNSPILQKLTNQNCKKFTDPLKKYYEQEKTKNRRRNSGS